MILKAENLSKRYMRKSGQANYFHAVKGVSLGLRRGELTVLMGRSGSGKTTLLHMLSGLLTPSEGVVQLGDADLYSMDDGALSRLRNEKIGVVPQGRSAIDSLTVLENVLLPAQLNGQKGNVENALRWLDALGISHLRDARPAELSGGELRRMAVTRALVGNAQVILADEPTGDLDDENTTLVLDLLRDVAKKAGRAVLLVSHDGEAARIADSLYRMDGGAIKVEGETL